MFRKQAKCSGCGFLAIDMATEIIALAKDSPEKLSLVQEIGWLGLIEFTQRGRENISKGALAEPLLLNCARHIWSKADLEGKDEEYVEEFLNSKRKCPYFFSYIPGYLPNQHMELQRERDHRRFLIIVSLLSAAVGAVIALLANYVISLLTS